MISREGLRNAGAMATFLAAHPKQLVFARRWLRDLRQEPLHLRQPWWTYDIIGWVAEQLPQAPRVFEFGGGGSSLWLLDHGASLTVVEHHPDWASKLRTELPTAEVRHVPPSRVGQITSVVEPGFFDEYVSTIDGYPDMTFDFVIVDGRARVDCVLHAIPKIRQGGLLLLDDSDRSRYQPAVEALSHWCQHTARGLKAASTSPATTSVWLKPVAP